MGVAGVAIGTIISQLISCVLVLTCLYRSEGSYQLRFSKLRINGAYMEQIFQVGVPAGIQSTVINLSNALLQSSVNSFGSIAMAGYTAANNMLGFLYMSVNSITQACMSFTSQNYGYILLEPKFKGKMYVEGLYIQSDDNFKYGYNFNSDVVDLDRDRKAINYYELRRLTAASVVTAETCCPELFKAISDSYTDVKDITDVLDDASDDFLQQYRDMLYEEKGLEENTLVATESVMRQLEQMDVDMPIVKGTEIESYLIAKANDKLGLIYQAKEAASKKSDEDDAWHYVRNSNWMSLKCWFDKYCKRISKEGKEQFASIMNRMEPSDLYHIKKYLPEGFIWTEENFDDLEEQIKNRT